MQPVSSCQDRLIQLTHVLAQLTNEEYSKPLPVLHYASIGGHVRHIIEFFQCLFEQCEQGIINYDLRRRDLMIEQSLEIALEKISEIIRLFESVKNNNALTLSASLSMEESERILVPTNMMREVLYQLDHTIHHMALIKIGISHTYEHIGFSSDFGLAASTLRNTKFSE
jgi:hypothetical protein